MPDKTDPPEKRVDEILKRLKKEYPDGGTALNYRTPLELLVAVILSAQCTDERVNKVTERLFNKYRSARDFAEAPLEWLEEDIRSTGFFRQKAKNIQGTCRLLLEEHNGQVPGSMEELVKLPGVARKTANVILGEIFNIAVGVVVDTHIKRVSNRLAFSEQKDPNKIEKDLMELLPKEEWIAYGDAVIRHGRQVCVARKPKCGECFLADLCPSAQN